MSDPAVWRSKDGRTVKITDMSDRHLANAIRVLTVDGAPVSRSGKQRLLLLRDEQQRRQEAGISAPDTPQPAPRRCSRLTSAARPPSPHPAKPRAPACT